MKKINIGLAGLGVIGGGVVHLLRQNRARIRARTGLDLLLLKAADLDKKKAFALKLSKEVYTKQAEDIIRNPDIDIAVELMGGTGYARKFLVQSLKNGKQVVTANKALLAEYFHEIYSTADKYKKNIGFEASVAGSIPVIKVLQESFLSNPVHTVCGILNGTTNYILTRMTTAGLSFQEALKEAQQKGYAEADPTLDIEGVDAAHKIQILASFAFGSHVQFRLIPSQGITRVDSMDISYANELGYVIKLLALARKQKRGSIEAWVQPVLLPEEHLMANVNYEFNAVYLNGTSTGESVLYGKGAGALPTANAVVSDIVDTARALRSGERTDYSPFIQQRIARLNSGINSRYYFRLMTIDRPGVLGRIAGILGRNEISISSCVQKQGKGKVVPLVLTTHECSRMNMGRAISTLEKLEQVKGKPVVMNIQEGI